MVYKRYNSPFEEKSDTVKPHEEYIVPKPEENPIPTESNQGQSFETTTPLGFLDNLAYDDIILIGLIIILLAENKDNRDVPLILTLGFLFLIQYIDAD